MDNLLSTLLLVIPGLLAFYLTRKIGPANSRTMTDLERTIMGLSFNIPGLTVVWVGVSLVQWKLVSFKMFVELMQSTPLLLLYLIVAFISAVFIATWWNDKGNNLVEKWVSKRRNLANRPNASSETVWETFFGTEADVMWAIYPIGEREKAVFGQVKKSYLPGDTDKGVLLIKTLELQPWLEYMGPPERTYIDVVGKLVYEMYSTQAWHDAKRRVEDVTQDATTS